MGGGEEKMWETKNLRTEKKVWVKKRKMEGRKEGRKEDGQQNIRTQIDMEARWRAHMGKQSIWKEGRKEGMG